MLIDPDSKLYIYTITRDFGFAPNPFHGVCTLATCKPKIRKSASVGDWVMGIGGADLENAKSKCVYAMRVSDKIGFVDYWEDKRFNLKRPSRNGSKVQMLGDNIYHLDEREAWIQEDSHHSNSDGTVNPENLQRDTGHTDQVLISDLFFYFGKSAIEIDLNSIGYRCGIGHKKIVLADNENAQNLIKMIATEYSSVRNFLIDDPCQFLDSHKRADQGTRKIYS